MDMNNELTEIQSKTEKMRQVLNNYAILVSGIRWHDASSFECYQIYPVPGTRIQTLRQLETDIAVSLGVPALRIVVMEDSVGIEVPKKDRKPLLLQDCIEDYLSEKRYRLPVILGEGLHKSLRVADLTSMPHLLISGATKQGKTEYLKTMILSLVRKKEPEELKFVLIDPKNTEFAPFRDLVGAYLATLPGSGSVIEEKENCIATDSGRAELMLSSLCRELEERYELLSKAGVSDIEKYNKKLQEGKLLPKDGHRHLPYLVCVCDEYADLVMFSNKKSVKSIKNDVIRLAQKGRAAGIHMVIATQRPCADVITGMLKYNFPARMAFRVASKIDSIRILDTGGAEKLSGNGDVLFSCGMDCERLQAPMIEKEELVKAIADAASPDDTLGSGTPYYLPEVVCGENENMSNEPLCPDEPLYDAAMSLVVMTQSCSQTMLQRKLGIGFARAGRLVDLLIEKGVVVGKAGDYVVMKNSLEKID